jgi:hypothetical protein
MISVKVEWIGPEEARELLDLNTGNFRNKDQSRVNLYAKEMAAGRWELTGDTIKISSDGVLLDGQHRLLAVIKAGVRVQMMIARGVESSGYMIDRGKPRTISQWCSHVGIQNASKVSAASKLILAYQKGLWTKPSLNVYEIPDSEQVDFIEKNAELLSLCVKQGRLSERVLSTALVAAVLYIGCDGRPPQDVSIATWFSESLAHGNGLSEKDVVLHLRNRLLQQRQQSKIDRYLLRALVTIAWNKTVRGEPCSANALRLRMVGPAAQELPNKIELVSDWQ